MKRDWPGTRTQKTPRTKNGRQWRAKVTRVLCPSIAVHISPLSSPSAQTHPWKCAYYCVPQEKRWYWVSYDINGVKSRLVLLQEIDMLCVCVCSSPRVTIQNTVLTLKALLEPAGLFFSCLEFQLLCHDSRYFIAGHSILLREGYKSDKSYLHWGKDAFWLSTQFGFWD